MISSDEIRETFLAYFEDKGHQRVNSGSLVPKGDPTLLFTNAGMNQFKDVFLGTDKRAYSRATSSQKCMRVSGKHNDLETVGRTPRHHTFFEMLGNFSFGDYFKQQAIEFAWELCTRVYGIESNQLIATVFEDDDEAYDIWRNGIGIPAERLFRCDAKENFWAMGETGPCGPCSELHYDMGDRIGDKKTPFGIESDRYVEIWNLVFMQYNRDSKGDMTPLPSPSIDTGMGLERITSVLQGVASNYETDLFKPLIEEAGRLTDKPYGSNSSWDVSLRILADHSRAAMFLIDDGVVPGNEGRNYVLRKILRRAIRHAKMLGREEPFIFTLSSLVAELMRPGYPELEKSREYAAQIVRNEEEKFSATLSQGLTLLEDVISTVVDRGESVIPGEELFKLYDTFGFPFDLAVEISEEKGLTVDEPGFHEELEKQRQRARASWKGGETSVRAIDKELAGRHFETEFTGYTSISDVPGEVLGIVKDGVEVDLLREGQVGEVVLSRTPFYAEAGGQVADLGIIQNERVRAEVSDVVCPVSGLRLHRVTVQHGELCKGDTVTSEVYPDHRSPVMCNHTATHLLHASLRETLGQHVKQSGSLVAPDRLRFDFTHYKALSPWEIRQIETRVNEKVRDNIEVRTEIKELDQAIRDGAMALFGEKYDQNVRVVSIPGFSTELCGGTHVSRTGDIALFKIISEGSISSGVRRIEAVTSATAVSRFLDDEVLLQTLSQQLRVGREQVGQAVARLISEIKDANREIERLQLELARKDSAGATDSAREVCGVSVIARAIPNADRNTLRQVADQLQNKLSSGVVVLGSSANGKVNLVIMVSDDLTDRLRADKLVGPIARVVEGGGGGKADMAEAGGKKPELLDQALAKAYELVEQTLRPEAQEV